MNTTKTGRPVDPTKAKRTKFTTMLNPELIKQLKKTAIDKDMSAADLLESILQEELAA